MYHRVLHVGIFGLEEPIVQAISAQEPPEDFDLDIVILPTIDEETLATCNIAILTPAAAGNMSFKQAKKAILNGKVGYHALAAVMSQEDAAALAEEELVSLDGIWPDPLPLPRAVHEFNLLLDQAKLQADAYIANAYLDTLIDSMPEMVWFKRLSDGAHMKVNAYFCDIVDKERDDVTGKHHNYIWNVPPEDQDVAELTCRVSEDKCIESGITYSCEENVSTHGEIRLFATYKTPIYDEDGTVLGTSGFAHDITEERKQKHLAWLNARTDYLTGTYNRRYFHEYIHENADKAPFSFVMLDLDNFKDVNDTKGHIIGDQILQLVCNIMEEYFKDCVIVRWGGDEFIIVIPDALKDLATEQRYLEMTAEIGKRSMESLGITLTASGGLVHDVVPEKAGEAIIMVDKALFAAKDAGKSCLIIADD